jgi:NADPH-dependent 2,4-dienoyl-CoA reductase/sulfur reductase-like enzyme
MSSPTQPTTKKRVLIVGAGAAGMSCADGLSQHPERFDVTLIDAQDYCGGQMFSIPIDEKKFGAPWLNQGVQGCVRTLLVCQTARLTSRRDG